MRAPELGRRRRTRGARSPGLRRSLSGTSARRRVRRGLVAASRLRGAPCSRSLHPVNARLAYDRALCRRDGTRRRRCGRRASRGAARRRGRLRGVAGARARRPEDDEEARGDAAELLGRLPERGRVHEVHEGGARLRPDLFQEGADECVTRGRPVRRRPRAPLRRRLTIKSPGGAPARPGRRPATGARRTTARPPSAFSVSRIESTRADTALEGVLAIWRAAVKALPEARNATYVEWWAHTRRRGDGHALHYDSVPGLVDEAPPRHPLASTVTFLEASVGGPTIIFDQTVANKRSTRAWVAPARPNRLLVFDGSLLHGVVPGGRGQGRRTTFMANFWRDDPRAGDASDREATGHQHPVSAAGLEWPADFASVGT